MSLYVRNPSCEAIELDGETMILNPDGFTLTQLNPVGSYCWSLLGEAHSVASLAAVVRTQFEGADLAVEQDLSLFLHELMECGLLAAAEK